VAGQGTHVLAWYALRPTASGNQTKNGQ
jgi:hypothetical protein